MSNFLNNLVARTLHFREPVRPRLASLFEPPSLAAALPSSFAPEQPASDPPVAAPSTVMPPAPPPDAARFGTGARPGGEPHARTPAQTEPDHSAGEPRGERHEVRAMRPAAQPEEETAEQKGLPPPRPADAPAERRVTRPAPVAPPTQAEVVRRESVAPAIADERGRRVEARSDGEAVQSLRERVAALAASMSEDRRRQETVAPAAFVPAAAPPPHIVTPRVERAAAARPFEPREEPPHINVTIGRVDVRAVQPQTQAAQPKRAPGRAQTATLEEYLRRREGGRR